MRYIIASNILIALVAAIVLVNVLVYRQRKTMTPEERKKRDAEADHDSHIW
jgi:hypothetical protein